MWQLRNNVFEHHRKTFSEKINSHQKLLERIGSNLICGVENGEYTLENVIDDIIAFVNYSPGRDKVHSRFCWLALHLALGICCQFKSITPKTLTRRVLFCLLLHSSGVDYGIFLRDIFDLADGGSNFALPEKSAYLLRISSGFRIDLHDEIVVSGIFKGSEKCIWSHLIENGSCYYLDLPIGHPITYISRSRMKACPLTLAMLNLRPKAVLILLQHGASPLGRPLEYLLRTLSTMHLFPAMENPPNYTISYSKEILQECLEYCYRVIPTIRVRFRQTTKTEMERKVESALKSAAKSDMEMKFESELGGETESEQERNDVYYVKKHDEEYLPPFWSRPASLKHLSRCRIRDCLIHADNLPDGIFQLDLMGCLTDYLNLLS